MKFEDLMESLKAYKAGTFIALEWEKDISSAKSKKMGIQVIKRSSGVIRTKINYRNLKATQNQEKGEKKSWFEHLSECILQSKNDNSKKYFQAFPVPSKKFKVKMLVDGKEASPQHLYDMGLINKSALENIYELNSFVVDVNNIVKFGRV